jgi:hypothetical protein
MKECRTCAWFVPHRADAGHCQRTPERYFVLADYECEHHKEGKNVNIQQKKEAYRRA